jgi:hypothetical protein
MRNSLSSRRLVGAVQPLVAAAFGVALLAGSSAWPQNHLMQQRVAEIGQTAAANMRALAQYTWQEQQTISVRGRTKKQTLFQVRLGPDGKPQKAEISPQQQAPKAPPIVGGWQRRVAEKAVQKRAAEIGDYAKQIAALAQSYSQPDPQKLQELFRQGNISLTPAGAANEVRLVILSYLKQGDTVTIVFNRGQKALQLIEVASYLDDPGDAVTISAKFARLPGGPDHVDSIVVKGARKHLTVTVQNSNYQRL